MFRQGKHQTQVTFDPELTAVIRENARKSGVDEAESLKRSISVYKYFSDQVMNGCNVLIVDPETQQSTTLVISSNPFPRWEAELSG